MFLEDGDVAVLTPKKVEIFQNKQIVSRPVELIDWSFEDVKKGGFPHYMLKEIYEQPQAFFDTVHAITQEMLPKIIQHLKSVTIVACGSSYHTG